jgi:saccharopine dehydrogenase (NADP+, L-glutamate forming)
MGLFSDEVPTLVSGNLLDTLSAQLAKICSFQPGERDPVMLQHKFVVEWKDGSKVSAILKAMLPALSLFYFRSAVDTSDYCQDTITSTLELFGEPGGYSAMAKSVGITCGIATQMLLDGFPALSKPGVLAPYSKDICEPLRAKVEAEGIKLVEKVL